MKPEDRLQTEDAEGSFNIELEPAEGKVTLKGTTERSGPEFMCVEGDKRVICHRDV